MTFYLGIQQDCVAFASCMHACKQRFAPTVYIIIDKYAHSRAYALAHRTNRTYIEA